MPKRTPPAKSDVADVRLTATTVAVQATKSKPPEGKRKIHERRSAPPLQKGTPTADPTPSDPATITRAPLKPPSTPRKRRGHIERGRSMAPRTRKPPDKPREARKTVRVANAIAPVAKLKGKLTKVTAVAAKAAV